MVVKYCNSVDDNEVYDYQGTKEQLELDSAPARYALALFLSKEVKERDKFERMTGIMNGVLYLQAKCRVEALYNALDIIDNLPNQLGE